MKFLLIVIVFCGVVEFGVCGKIRNNYIKHNRPKVEKVSVYYFSPHKRHEVKIEEIKNTKFNTSQPLKLIIHGFFGGRKHITVVPLINAYLAKGDVHVFSVGWESLASLNYDMSRSYVPKVGNQVAKIMEKFMKENGFNENSLHILGHSLGAHVAGNIGKYFNGKVNRITALDPAGPLFLGNSTDAINVTDALFIDTIHTGSGVLGELRLRSHIDFYPNRGFPPQPGCYALDLLTFTACSHYRAVILYAESIINPSAFLSAQCSMEEIFTSIKKCKPKYNLDGPRHLAYMGEFVSRKSRGIFYLDTNNSPPYGKGMKII